MAVDLKKSPFLPSGQKDLAILPCDGHIVVVKEDPSRVGCDLGDGDQSVSQAWHMQHILQLH
jgi:hypothetical protein